VRALITGGAGFVGRHLAAHLESEGDVVASVDREHDVSDFGEMAGVLRASRPDAVFHLAALSHVGDSWHDPTESLRVNVLGTASVLAAARNVAPDATVLVISSAEVYGIVSPAELPLTEVSEVRPASPYAASKAAAEVVALQAFRGYGQRVIVIRPFNHIGPGQAPTFFVSALAHRLVEARRAGVRSIPVGSLEARRDFTDVRDVVRGYRAAAVLGSPGSVYNLASGVDVAVADVAARLVAIAHPGATLVEEAGLMRPLDIPVLRGDATKLRECTGWAPSIPLDRSLEDIVADAGG
jgi:GDP-4-dehydro-6-deoxy-D-mannose reductase